MLGKSPCAVCNPPRLSSSPSNSDVGVREASEDRGTPSYVIVIVLIIGFFIVRSMFRKSQSPAQTPVQPKEELPKVQQVPLQTASTPKNERQATVTQKSLPSVSKPAPAKLDTPSRRYLVGDVYYCWDYYYGDVFSARILSTSQRGAEVEINGTTKSVSYADLDRRFYPHPEDIPEYRSIKHSHPYRSTAAQESAKEKSADQLIPQKPVTAKQHPKPESVSIDSHERKVEENNTIRTASLNIEKSCNNCRLRKGGQCSQVRNVLCEDYIALPDEMQIGIARQKEANPSQLNNTPTKSSGFTELSLSDIIGATVWVDIPGGGSGTIVNAEPIILKGRHDIKINVLFDNGTVKSLALSICSRNRWFEVLSGKIKKEDIKAYFDRKVADEATSEEKVVLNAASQEEKTKAKKDAVLNERRSAYRYLVEERDVQYLMHFTPVENIQSILDNGIIPRYYLMRDRKNVVVTDEERWDNRPDCTSFSISFPNYRMMFKKQNDFKFALLLVDPAVLLDLSIDQIYYLPDNAARMSKYGIDNYKGLDALKGLFSTPVKTNIGTKTREELDIPDCFPSNPQAEVFIGGTVKPKYIKAVVVDDPSYAKALRNKLRLPPDWDESMVGHSISYFKQRVDYKYWQ